jgi:hypothetical protein
MLHAMSFRSVLGSASVAFVVVTSMALATGCDALKHNDADAAAAAPVVVPAVPATTAAPGTPAPPVTTVAPLGGAVPTPAGGAKVTDGGKPVATDGGAATDAGAVTADGGKAAPAPTPTFTIPTAIPGFDAGAFKPPPGFPSTIPTFPQPPAPAPTPTR